MADSFDDPWEEPDQVDYWRPSIENPEVRGRVTAIGYETGGKYGAQLVLTVHNKGQGVKVTCTAMLKRAVEEQRPGVGDEVRIKYFGDRQSNGVNEDGSPKVYKLMDLRVRQQDPAAVPQELPTAPKGAQQSAAAVPSADDFDDGIPF